MKDASIQPILAVEKHDNADSLDIVSVLGFKAIVRRDTWKVGELCAFILPDSVLPDLPWATLYRAKSNRVKAIRLRQRWSEGVVESLANVGYTGPVEVGRDISAEIGVTHYAPPLPQELNAKGLLPLGIPKTDEDRVEVLDAPPWGELVDVTTKVDGQSASFYWHMSDDGVVTTGVLGRTLEFDTAAVNNYTRNATALNALAKLDTFCRAHGNVSLCVRGESYGQGIQSFALNPHSKLPLNWAMFSVWLIKERRYARKGDQFYALTIAAELDLPTVPVMECDVLFSHELVERYRSMETLNGAPFEGVVCQWAHGSCKLLSRHYDSKK